MGGSKAAGRCGLRSLLAVSLIALNGVGVAVLLGPFARPAGAASLVNL
jgi:hypothetical protein